MANPMKILSNTRVAILAIGLVAGFTCQGANARPIVGSIDFGGVVTYDTTSLATATRVDIWNSSFVLQDSGDFSSISPGTNVTMAAPWIFNPSTQTPALWSVGGFTFDLQSSTITAQNSQFLNITGIGTISGNGFDSDARILELYFQQRERPAAGDVWFSNTDRGRA